MEVVYFFQFLTIILLPLTKLNRPNILLEIIKDICQKFNITYVFFLFSLVYSLRKNRIRYAPYYFIFYAYSE